MKWLFKGLFRRFQLFWHRMETRGQALFCVMMSLVVANTVGAVRLVGWIGLFVGFFLTFAVYLSSIKITEESDTEPLHIWLAIVVIGGISVMWSWSSLVACGYIAYFVYEVVMNPEFSEGVYRNINAIKCLIDPPVD